MIGLPTESETDPDASSWNWLWIPGFIGMMGLLLAIFGGIIKLKRAIPIDPSSLSLISVPSALSELVVESGTGVKNWLGKRMSKAVSRPGHAIISFWKRVPRRFWNFYVDAFLVPSYRQEWGKYQDWSYRSPYRPNKREFIYKHLQLQKLETEEQKQRRQDMPSLISVESTDPVVKKKKRGQANQFNPVLHDHSGCKRVRINVSGNIFETQLKTLSRYPDSLLGNPERRLKYFNPLTQEYFFDRHRSSFETILYFYQSGGRFRRPDTISADILLDDAKFYGIPQGIIYQFLIDEGLALATQPDEILPSNLFLRKVWLLFDCPESSMQARIVAMISVFSIAASIVTFCLETESSLNGRNLFEIDDKTGLATQISLNPLDIKDPFFIVETVCSAWFSLEYVARLISSPEKCVFLTSLMNIIDLLAIAPFYAQLATSFASELMIPEDPGDVSKRSAATSFSFIRVIRLVRVFRIFKLSRHSSGLKILGKTLKSSMNELMLLVMFVLIGVILFSSSIYFAELGGVNQRFPSIPEGFWWALITITTVGYGDVIPETGGGKIVGALCAIAGVLTIALPVPVIVSNFNFFYNQALGEQDLNWMKISHVPACPFRPMTSCRGIDLPADEDHEQGQIDWERTMKRGRVTRTKMEFSSDEEFGELKDRALKMQGIQPPKRKKKVGDKKTLK